MGVIVEQARALAAEIARDLQPVADRLIRHPYLAALEAGRIPKGALRLFAGEQYAIIGSDLRSVARLVSRFGAAPSRDFFLDVLQGERSASDAVTAFAHAVGMDEATLRTYEPLPGTHAYTGYMAWLACYASDAEVAAAYLANFPAWGQSCARMSQALKTEYGLRPADLAFFDLFAAAPPGFEEHALQVIETGLRAGIDSRLVRRAARLLQGYELLFWDTLHEASTVQ